MEKKRFVGIDISKKTLDVVIYDSKKKHADCNTYRRVTNDEEGYKNLLGWFKSERIKLSELVVGLENTGAYGYDLCLFLESKQVDYCSFNPLTLKRSMGLVRGKNDKVDAERIAYFTWLHRDELKYTKLAGSTILRLRELSTERKRFVKQRTEYEGLLTERKRPDMTSSSLRAEKMRRILEEEIDAVEKEMEEVIKQDPQIHQNFQLLMSIKGIGKVNAISTIIHTNNFESFQTARQYACYLGIAPFEHSSGTSIKGKPKVSCVGAKQLKADLSQAAMSAVQWDREIRLYYVRKINEGKTFGVVLNAIKFKLVCRMFAVIRRGTPYVDLMAYKN